MPGRRRAPERGIGGVWRATFATATLGASIGFFWFGMERPAYTMVFLFAMLVTGEPLGDVLGRALAGALRSVISGKAEEGDE